VTTLERTESGGVIAMGNLHHVHRDMGGMLARISGAGILRRDFFYDV
jgi:hypothetical protein